MCPCSPERIRCLAEWSRTFWKIVPLGKLGTGRHNFYEIHFCGAVTEALYMEGMSCSFVSISLSLPPSGSLSFSLSLSRLGLSRLRDWTAEMCFSLSLWAVVLPFSHVCILLTWNLCFFRSQTLTHLYSCSYCRKINCVIEKTADSICTVQKSFNQTFWRFLFSVGAALRVDSEIIYTKS